MVTGSRGWTDRARIADVLSSYDRDEWIVIHGGARGVDTIAGEVAAAQGFEVEIYMAEWDKYGRSAGFRRNITMVDCADEVIAFWDGRSRGTKHAIDAARERGLSVRVFREWTR